MSVETSNLEDLVKQWGNALAVKCSTTCEWIDLHARQPAMANYQQNKLDIQVRNIRYAGNLSSIEKPGYVIEDTSVNDTSSPQLTVFRQTKETTSNFSWSLKSTIRTGLDTKFTISIPPIISSTINSTEISTESSISKTETEVETWTIERHVTVSPQKKMDMIWTIKEQEASGTFYADVVHTGSVAIWMEDDVDIHDPDGDDEHNLWFTPITSVFGQMKEMGIAVPWRYTVLPGIVIYHIFGKCTGVSGYETTFILNETPLNVTNTKSGQQRCINALSIPAY